MIQCIGTGFGTADAIQLDCMRQLLWMISNGCFVVHQPASVFFDSSLQGPCFDAAFLRLLSGLQKRCAALLEAGAARWRSREERRTRMTTVGWRVGQSR